MKILFFLMLTANVALFMWEYKAGAFAPNTEAPTPAAAFNEEPILLLAELKNASPGYSPTETPATLPAEPVEKADVAVSTGASAEQAAIEPAAGILDHELHKIFPDAAPAKIPATFLSEPVEQPDVTVSTEPVAIEPPVSALEQNNPVKIEEHETDPVQCYEIGPFAGERTYQAWVNQLPEVNSSIKPVTRDKQAVHHYMVYYPAAETLAKSQANLQMLKDQGYHDLWLLSTGTEQGQISLGVFSTEERALAMQNQMIAKGINAGVKPLYKTKAQKYALLKTDSVTMDQLDVLKKTNPELSVKQIPDVTNGCW